LLAIANLVKAGAAGRPVPKRRRGTVGRPFVGEKNGLERRGHKTGVGQPASLRRMNAAVPLRSNLLRLEHELRTVVNGSASSCRDYSGCMRYLRHRLGCGNRRRHAAARKVRLPCSLRVSGSLVRPRAQRAGAPERIESGVHLRSPFGSRRGGRAGCPDGTQPEPLTVSDPFLRPLARNWQAACAI